MQCFIYYFQYTTGTQPNPIKPERRTSSSSSIPENVEPITINNSDEEVEVVCKSPVPGTSGVLESKGKGKGKQSKGQHDDSDSELIAKVGICL
jgi:hypothetical protein